MEFTINRRTLRCGGNSPTTQRGTGETKLLNSDGFMCCLGQISLQLGATTDDILEVAAPEDLALIKPCDLSLLRYASGRSSEYVNTELTVNAVLTNDNETLDDSQREARLAALFAEQGHELTFVGDYHV